MKRFINGRQESLTYTEQPTDLPTYIHTCTHIKLCTYIHKHTHTHTYTYTLLHIGSDTASNLKLKKLTHWFCFYHLRSYGASNGGAGIYRKSFIGTQVVILNFLPYMCRVRQN